jgi:uncharacterized SAM-binding protein YcdF (DUF218 family)
MKYAFKHVVAILTSPLAVVMLLALAAGICRLRGRRVASLWLGIAAMLIGYLSCIDPVGNALLAPLERQYPPLRTEQTLSQVEDIVVLGGGYAPRDHIPVTGALEDDSLARIVEGVRLARRAAWVRLIVSGGAPEGIVPSAIGYAILARDLGIDDRRLLVLDKSLDTGAEARTIAKLLGSRPFLLVTSAYHMPRAMRLMVRAGAHPIPAPTDQRSDWSGGFWSTVLPTSVGLHLTERALHEYIGLLALACGLQ